MGALEVNILSYKKIKKSWNLRKILKNEISGIRYGAAERVEEIPVALENPGADQLFGPLQVARTAVTKFKSAGQDHQEVISQGANFIFKFNPFHDRVQILTKQSIKISSVLFL